MDRAIYIAMNAAARGMQAQAVAASNLANVSTQGFRAQLAMLDRQPVLGDGLPTRVNAVVRELGVDFSTGAQITSGRDLDIAIQGEGWIAVQARDGSEGYTRAGNLDIDANGMLTTASGLPVLGDNGPLVVPPFVKLDIGQDGTVSVVPQGQGPETVSTIGRIKLVNPPRDDLVLAADGLLRTRTGDPAPADATVKVMSGVVEGSNVNPTEALLTVLSLARQFEMQMRAIEKNDQNAQAATQLLRP